MSLIPGIQLVSLQRMTAAEIRELPCSEIINKYGDYIATLTVPMTDFIKTHAEYNGVRNNAIWSGDFEDETPVPEPEPVDPDAWVQALREPKPSEFICSKCKAIHRRSDTTKNGKHEKSYTWVAPAPAPEPEPSEVSDG